MSKTPKKLVRDAIAEALCEVRFECKESISLPETVVSRLAEFKAWRDFENVRMPASDIPVSVRSQNPNLKYLPLFELRDKNEPRVAKIGANALSYHRLAPYPGWDLFKPEIDAAIDHLFGSLQDFRATRMGFRYVNVFTNEDHGVGNVSHLNYSIDVAGHTLREPQILNYRVTRSDKHIVQVRIASPEFVTGSGDKKVDALVDLDVFTPDGWETKEARAARDWIEQAHEYEKEEFFKLFTQEMDKRLVEVR
jgi:uncharacterized protein (TIGR04255 family)